MNDEDFSFDELADSQDDAGRAHGGGRRHGRRRGAPRRRRGGFLRGVLPVLLVLAVLGGLGVGGYQGYRWLTSNVSLEQEAAEFEGPGSGEALVEVGDGDTGSDIASTLVDEGVIKSSPPFVALTPNPPPDR